MAKIRLPRYVRVVKLAKGGVGYYWSLPTWAKPPAEKFGRVCTVASEALAQDLAAAISKANILCGA